MKLALIGDLQYRHGDDENELRRYLAQVDAWGPDFAVSMGDMGAHGETGTLQGFAACADFLRAVRCPQAVLLGNHDVEYRPDDGFARTPEAWYAQCFGRREPWRAMEMDGVFLLCLSVERQPEETFYTQHALYVSDCQFAWARDQLAAHRAWPTVVVSHAPLAGSGLRCVPYVHSAATDAYLDHTFDAMRWKILARNNPQIRLWCSAHFHMGHEYQAAITEREGIVHVSCGVPCACARDGSRETRLLEIGGEARVLTLDHLTGALREDAVVPMSAVQNGGAEARLSAACEVLVGEDRTLAVYDCPAWGRAYITTEYGKIWEYDRALGDLGGAIRRQTPVRALAVEDDRLFFEDAQGEIHSVSRDDRARFEVRGGYGAQAIRSERALPSGCLEEVPFTCRVEREGEYIHF